MSNKRPIQPDRTTEKKSRMFSTFSTTTTAKRPTTQDESYEQEFFGLSQPPLTNRMDSKLQQPRHVKASSSSHQNGYWESKESGVRFTEGNIPVNKFYDLQGSPYPYENLVSYYQEASNARPKSRDISPNAPFYQISKKRDASQLSNTSDLSFDSIRNIPTSQGRATTTRKQKLSDVNGFPKGGLKSSRDVSPRQGSGRKKYGDYLKNTQQTSPSNGISHRFEEFMEKLKVDKERFYNQLGATTQRTPSPLNNNPFTSSPFNNPFTSPSSKPEVARGGGVLNLSIEELVNRNLNIKSNYQTPELIATSPERHVEQPQQQQQTKIQKNPSGSDARMRGQATEITIQWSESGNRNEPEPTQRGADISMKTSHQKLETATQTPAHKSETLKSTELPKEPAVNTREFEMEILKLKKEAMIYENKLKERDRQISEFMVNEGKLKERDRQIAELKEKLKETAIQLETMKALERQKESSQSQSTPEIEIELLKLKREALLNENKLKERDQTISELKEQLRETFEKMQKDQVDRAENLKAQLEIEKIGNEKKQLEKDLEVSKALSAKLQKTLEDFEVQMNSYKTQMETSTKSTKEKEENLKKQVDALNQEIKILRENNETLKKTVSDLQGSANNSKESNEVWITKFKQSLEREEELKKQIELMKQTIDGKMKEIELLKQMPKDSGAAEEEVQKLKSDYSNISLENEKNKTIIKNLNEQINTLNIKVNEALEKANQIEIQRREQVNVFSTKLDEAQARVRLLESQASDNTSSSNARLLESQEKIKQTEQQAQDQIAALSAMLNEAQAKIQLLESKPNDQIIFLQAKIDEYQAKIKILESQSSSQSSDMSAKYEDAQAKIVELETQLKQAQLEVQKAHLDTENARAEAKKAKAFDFASLPENTGDEASLRIENQRLEKEMSIIIEKFEKMKKELEEAEKAPSEKELQKELDDAHQQIIDISNRLMEIQLEKQDVEKKYNYIFNDKSKVSDKEKAARLEADKLKKENKMLTDKLTSVQKDYEKKLTQEAKTNLDLKNQITKITAKDKVAAAAEEARVLAEKLSIELNTLKEQNTKMIEELTQQITKLSEENDKTKRELEVKTKKLASVSGGEEATAALVARTKEVLRLKEEIQKLKSQIGGAGQGQADPEMVEELERFKKLFEDQKALIKKYQGEIRELTKKLSDKEDQAEGLAENVAKLQAELAKYVKK